MSRAAIAVLVVGAVATGGVTVLGRWVHVIADNGIRGWLETAALCGRSGKVRFGEP
jgi:hypothetical protein